MSFTRCGHVRSGKDYSLPRHGSTETRWASRVSTLKKTQVRSPSTLLLNYRTPQVDHSVTQQMKEGTTALSSSIAAIEGEMREVCAGS